MSRDDGFAVADVDSGYFEDAKLRDLWQRLHNPDQMARAVVLHQATVLASWRQGGRVTVTQACPLWAVVDADVLGALVAVKLLDRSGRLPVTSWIEWFGTAHKRREDRREAGRIGGLASGRSRTTDAEGPPKQPSTVAEPVRPSVRPSVPTVPSGPAEARATDQMEPPSLDVEPAIDAYSRFYPAVSKEALTFLDELAAEYGQEWTARAIGQAGCDGKGKLLTRAKRLLVLWARQADKDEAQAEKARNQAKRVSFEGQRCAKCRAPIHGGAIKTGAGPMHAGGCPPEPVDEDAVQAEIRRLSGLPPKAPEEGDLRRPGRITQREEGDVPWIG